MQYVNGKRPEPGRHITKIVEHVRIVEQSNSVQTINVDQVANAIIDNISKKMSNMQISMPVVGGQVKPMDDFNAESTMKKLADAMIVQNGSNQSNFENLGSVKTTAKNENTDSTIDLLSKLDD